MYSIKFIFTLLAVTFSIELSAGTLFFKDGSKLSDIDIISISEGEIIIEKDKAQKSYAVKDIKAFYNTNIETGGDTDPDKFVDYKISVISIDSPLKGEKKVGSKTKTEAFELEYTITKKSGEGKKLKVPYFYLHILTPGKDEFEGRKVYSYYYPKNAKPKGKGYDVAAILAEVLDFGRPEWDIDRAKARTSLMGKKVKIDLKSVGSRKILAWHLEVWGNADKIYEKSRIQFPEAGISKTWWKRKN